MRSVGHRAFVRALMAALLLVALAACGGDPPNEGGATWDEAVWDASTWQP